MLKYIFGVVIVIGVAVVGYYAWKTFSEPVSTPITPVVVEDTRSTYASTTLGISLKYPKEYAMDDAYAYMGFPKKPIHGVKFTIPLVVATGTNLSSDSYLSVEQLPRAKSCTGDIYLVENVKAAELMNAGVDYSVASSSGAGAGNFYEEIVYALAESKPCTAVRYYLHSMNIGNFATGTVREFDRDALLADFDKIRQSLILSSIAATSTGVTP